ncbi:Pycsar system effector family protein [Mucilaginibacter lutimaris]|uniref:Pycsar system effector family protein n=1 Tax=Mucilaginibacter lutimaris TaxID=931629 RepID=A0ABW2ZEA4_9SPHI
MENIQSVYASALGYLSSYYHSFSEENFNFGLSLCTRISQECSKIAKDEKLKGYDLGNALLACCFRFAGVTNIMVLEDTGIKLLNDFTAQVDYPAEEVEIVRGLISRHSLNEAPLTQLDKVVWDALDYRLAMDDLFLHVVYLKEELNRLNDEQYDELAILNRLQDELSGTHCYTDYAKKHYTDELLRNKNKVIRRIQRMSGEPAAGKGAPSAMSDKETEDLFKIAFRNYVKLVDVADSKAGLLIQVNSVLISVVIGFTMSRTEKYPMLIVPIFIILAVAFVTILLCILASRPQRNSYIQNRSSKSYQTFFFGSFDLVGTEFRDADFDTYSVQLDSFLKGGKEHVYNEMYKEVFNVRKVLNKKFTFLSYAYMVFLGGLAVSILAFFISTR